MDQLRENIRKYIRTKNPRVREFLAELLGTLFLVFVGNATVAQMVFSFMDPKMEGIPLLSVNWGYGFAVTFGVYISAGVSGGHLNPAISLAQFMLGNIGALQLVLYCVAQFVGAFIGAFFVFAVYFEKLNAIDPNRTVATMVIFSPFPKEHLSIWGGLGDQIVGTAVLSLCVLALTDKRNTNVPASGVPALVGVCVTMIGMAFAYNCGYAINPARDFGPRLFTLVAGWGRVSFYDKFLGYNWFWVPIVGPLIGGCVGAWLYQLCVGLHWPNGEELIHNGDGVRIGKTTEVVYVKKNTLEEDGM